MKKIMKFEYLLNIYHNVIAIYHSASTVSLALLCVAAHPQYSGAHSGVEAG